MNILPKSELQELIDLQIWPSVSIYIPTHKTGREVEENSIRLKNALREAEDRLIDNGVRAPEARKMLERANPLLINTLFWSHQDEGLVLFVSPSEFRYYRLPIHFDQQVIVSDRFFITPLLPLYTADGRFFVLAVNKNHIRLLQCTHNTVREVKLVKVPTNIEDILKYTEHIPMLNYHSVGVRGTGAGTAMFHGHGEATDEASKKKDLLDFLQHVDKNLMKLMDGERSPMVLAGVEYERSMYREISHYPVILQEGINGSSEPMTDEDLHREGWKIVEPIFRQSLKDSLEMYWQGYNSQRVSKDTKEIFRAADEGRIDTLFINKDLPEWGVIDPATGEIELHEKRQPGDRNLQNIIAIRTLSKGGTVYVLESRDSPVYEPMAALYRY